MVEEARPEGIILVRNQGDKPVFVGDAQPAGGTLVGDLVGIVGIGKIVVIDLLEGVVESADQALVQDVETQRRRCFVALDPAVGEQRDRPLGEIRDALGHREHVVIVDLEGALEKESLPVVPGDGDGCLWRESAIPCLPQGGRIRQDSIVILGQPAEFREIGRRSADR